MHLPSHRFPLLLLLVLVYGVCFPHDASAFSGTVSGAKADELRQSLQLAPYIAEGNGKKIVYVWGRHTCALTRKFRDMTRALHNEFEFRWILDPSGAPGKMHGVYMQRTPETLKGLFQKSPVVPQPHDRKAGVTATGLVTTLTQSLYPLYQTKRVTFPVLLFQTDKGMTGMDNRKEFSNASQLKKLLAPALPDAHPTGLDANALLQKADNAAPTTGDICFDRNVPARYLPADNAPFFDTLNKGYCYTLKTKTHDGWLGVKVFSDGYGLGFVKASEGQVK